jgi:hypothetical protein
MDTTTSFMTQRAMDAVIVVLMLATRWVAIPWDLVCLGIEVGQMERSVSIQVSGLEVLI